MGYDKTILLWDVATRQPLGPPLTNHTAPVLSVAFSPDAKTLASGSGDKTIILWDVASRQALGLALTGHTNSVFSVAFGPDGKTLASGSYDGTIRLWDAATRQSLTKPLIGHTAPVFSIAFSPDGKTLASGSEDKTLILWDMSFGSWQARACRIANRNLTQAEWNQFVGVDTPYKRTCPNLPVHPSIIDTGRKLARSGDVVGAVALFRRVLELDPDLELDPQAEANKWAAQGLLEQGRVLAQSGNIHDAVLHFQKALEQDVDLELEPQVEANKWAAKGLLKQGRKLAEGDDLDGAITHFQQALGLDPTLYEATQRIAISLVKKGLWLVKQGRAEESLAVYAEARQLDPKFDIPARFLAEFCWFGSLWGRAAEVMQICEQAVTREPGKSSIRGSRGLARALTGDTDGAVEDLQMFIKGTDEAKIKTIVQYWIDVLQAGENPFTPEVIEKLRSP